MLKNIFTDKNKYEDFESDNCVKFPDFFILSSKLVFLTIFYTGFSKLYMSIPRFINRKAE